MKTSGVIAVILILTFTMSGLCQESALEEKVRHLFLKQDGVPNLGNGLRELGDDKEIVPVLIRLASTARHAKEETADLIILSGAVGSLGVLRASSANDLLSSLLTDREVHENVRALAARSLGQIDSEANKQILLTALHNTSDYLMIRVFAAEGLAKTRDAEALKALERYGREDKDSYVREKFENAAQAMRANGVKPD